MTVTPLERLSLPGRTRSVVLLLALCAIGLVALVNPPVPIVSSVPGQTDYTTFRLVVDKLRTGAPYYPTMGAELRSRAYPLTSAFNWRTPLHLTGLSTVPESVARGVLIMLLAILLWATTIAVRPRFTPAWTTSAAMQLGVVVVFAAPSLVLLGETWSGVLVGLSVCAYARGRRAVAFASGLLALFMRELAAPYCVVCAMVAAFSRRWREFGLWIAGACLYAGYYGWHLAQVWAQRLPTDRVQDASWLEFGGLPFLQGTLRWSGWLFVLPGAWTALALVLIAGGVANPRAPTHLRSASVVYAVFFLVAGQPFNHYWGLMAGPMVALACGYGVETIAREVRTAFTRAESSA